VVEKTGLTIEEITRRAGYKRGTYYLHIRKNDLSATVLARYGKAIGHNFSEEIPDLTPLDIEDPESAYLKEPRTVEEAIKQRNEWKEKYYTLLEKYLKYIEAK
jgi:AcrR family transcriptional regulator